MNVKAVKIGHSDSRPLLLEKRDKAIPLESIKTGETFLKFGGT